MICSRSDMAGGKRVAVFCAASENIDPLYVDAATEVGTLLGSLGSTLIYGGARFGLMEATAKAAKATGARVVGVVPAILEERDRVSYLLDEKVSCRNLSERKDIMLERSDVLVALPGGVGTLDEIFHVMAAATIGYHHKHVVLYNVNGFWNGLLAVLNEMNRSGFVRSNLNALLSVATDVEDLKTILMKA
jgi:uncharacterized protein (TIGR00730 family)